MRKAISCMGSKPGARPFYGCRFGSNPPFETRKGFGFGLSPSF